LRASGRCASPDWADRASVGKAKDAWIARKGRSRRLLLAAASCVAK
jgi:hypothetical protein